MAILVLLAGFTAQAVPHPELLAQIEILSERLRAEPENERLLLQRGDLYRRHQDYTAAERDLAAARRLTPDAPLLDFYEGRLRLDMGDAADAALLLERYLSHEPAHAIAWRLRGEALAAAGEYAKAAVSFESAIRFSAHPGPGLFQWQVLALLAARIPGPEVSAVIDAGLERFGPEVTLLGLGVDLALSEKETGKAQAYLALLPEGLARLPAWRDRIEALGCLKDPAAGGDVCRRSYRSGLDAQLAAFEQSLQAARKNE